MHPLHPNDRIVVLSGAGLSAPSGIPTFRDADGLWEGHDVMEVATPEAWQRNPTLVRRFYDERRLNCGSVQPNAGHHALVELQRRLGVERCALITQNVDGLLTRAGAIEVIEMHGSILSLCCELDHDHPRVAVTGVQPPEQRCAKCGGALRPDIVWFGEIPHQLDAIQAAVADCAVFVSVGTSGVVYPAAGLVNLAKYAGALCIEVNPQPSGNPAFDDVIAESADVALPLLLGRYTS